MLGFRAFRTITITIIATASLVALTGCGDDGASAGRDDGRLQVEASFYPLAWITEQVGGEHVQVDNVTQTGAEPHDLELTPGDLVQITEADLVVYLRGFQPAIDDAVGEADEDAVIDVTPFADLTPRSTADAHTDGDTHDDGEAHGDGEDHDDVADDHDHDDDHEHGGGSTDPHFWLDPQRLAAVAAGVADVIADRVPAHRAAIEANLATLVDRLSTLDAELEAGLADCDRRDLVTSHDAFGYLAQRYDLTQVGIRGLTPDDEPSPADLTAVTDFVVSNGVSTIFFETLVAPDVARAIAKETGASTAVLDPIEGLSDASAGRDYLELMTANLASLRNGLGCR